MKKFILSLFAASFIFNASASYSNDDKVLLFGDLNTRNFIDRIEKLKLEGISYICTKDYCYDFTFESLDKNLESFENKYLSTIEDEEVKNTLKVKGIKITKIGIEK